jgi:chromosomal replication initiator protein
LPSSVTFFLCGGVLLGKTHLLHSIGHQQLANRPSARIVYLSSERFMNEYVQAIRTCRMHEFRRNYREGIDVLLIDDVRSGDEPTRAVRRTTDARGRAMN